MEPLHGVVVLWACHCSGVRRAGARLMRISPWSVQNPHRRRLREGPGCIMEVASMTGHKSLAMLKRYTHIEAEKLAVKLG